MYEQIKKPFRDCITAMQYFYQNQFTYKASALAFTSLFAVVPLISLIVYVMTKLKLFSELTHLVRTYIIMNLLPNSSGALIVYLDYFTEQAMRLPFYSILMLLSSAIMLIITIDNSMHSIWKKPARKGNIVPYLVYTLIILLLPLVVSIVALMSYILTLLIKTIPESMALIICIPFLINMFLFNLLYISTATKKVKLRNTLFGSFIATSLLELSKNFFSIYIEQFSNYHLVYGVLSTLPIFMIWLYIFWLIILYGACVIKVQFQQ